MLSTRTGIRYLPDYFSLLHSPFGAVLNGAAFVVAMKIKSTKRKQTEPHIMYICNRRRCQHCVKECSHTSQIEYAKYETHDRFELGQYGTLWEVRDGK